MFTAIDKFPLAAIPFFILAGNLMETGGISRRLVDFAKSLVGGVQGGLPMTCVLTCMIFAAVSGSSVATTFAIGAILIPALIRHGYPKPWAAALQATSAELGVVIPPSIPMILYGVAAEVSIGELFIAGFGPGLLIGGALMLSVFLYCKWQGWGRNDGDGRMPLRTAAIDVGALVAALLVFFLGKAVVGPWLGGAASADALDRITDLTGLLFGRGLLRRAGDHSARAVGAAAAGDVRADDAGHHPRRHLRRCLHADRSVGRRRVLCPDRRHVRVPRSRSEGRLARLKRSVISSAVIMFIIANAGLFAYLITRAGIPEQIGAFLKESLQTPQFFLLG